MIYQETETLRLLAKSWNNLDTRHIEEVLSENFIYESQWVLMPINPDSAIAYPNQIWRFNF